VNKPLVLKTHSTGADIAGVQNTFSNSAQRKCDVVFDIGPQNFASFIMT
jgi:hypothetical protein